jgi:Ni/Co efflux regulator RcnB
MLKLITSTFILCVVCAGPAIAQSQDAGAGARAQDKQAQEQAERDRRQAERDRKEKEKGDRKEPGSRCSRWKQGKA